MMAKQNIFLSYLNIFLNMYNFYLFFCVIFFLFSSTFVADHYICNRNKTRTANILGVRSLYIHELINHLLKIKKGSTIEQEIQKKL